MVAEDVAAGGAVTAEASGMFLVDFSIETNNCVLCVDYSPLRQSTL
jgi:hypothetical protein